MDQERRNELIRQWNEQLITEGATYLDAAELGMALAIAAVLKIDDPAIRDVVVERWRSTLYAYASLTEEVPDERSKN